MFVRFALAFCLCLPSVASAVDLANEAAPGTSFDVLDGFRVERLYSVPKEEQGSWVSLTVDESGRLYASDQYGKLYRITPPAISGGETKIEPVELEIGQAHGLLWAFNSLYVMVNGNAAGFYRVQDTDGDDRLDSVRRLRSIPGGGEHGPHAIILSPDKQSLYVCAGNHTDVPGAESSLVPQNWDEDQLLPRQWDARGHARGKLAPGGWIAKTDPEGKHFEIFCSGFRNEYDIAFNPEGELFTYDADMEWDIGTPWYRPTRVNHCTSGAEFGWRSGTGKWPADYPDSLGSVLNIGPGCPTGITFGTGADFPGKYQRALFISDWSYGVMYAVHLTPDGASYTGERESFISGSPLPLTDIAINPVDRAMYFTTGGRRVQSGLYRVTYEGAEPTTPAMPDTQNAAQRNQRRQLEALHHAGAENAVDLAWPHLQSSDRAIRYAARVAIEHQPVELWLEKTLTESHPVARTYAIVALARCAEPSSELLTKAVTALTSTSWDSQSDSQKVDTLRALALCFIRLAGDATPSDDLRKHVTGYLDQHFPANNFAVNRELARLLVYLQAPNTASRVLQLLESSPNQEEQIHYAYVLRTLENSWTDALREQYFAWFNQAKASQRGGASFGGFLDQIRDEAVKRLPADTQAKLKEILEAQPESIELVAVSRTEFVKDWQLNELAAAVGEGLTGRNFEKGKQYFQEAGCYKCHRYAGTGGITGPDLTAAGTRFSNRDLLESILHPSQVISDQYQATQYVLKDGRIVTGRVVNMAGDGLSIMENMLDPGRHTNVKRGDIDETIPSTLSMMPTGLLNTFQLDEILDLLAFVRSGANPNHAMFASQQTKQPRVLFLTQSEGFVHGSVNRRQGERAPAELAMMQLAKDTGEFRVVCTQNAAADITPENLKDYDIVMFYTTGKLPISEPNLQYLLGDWLKQKGHGFIGFHSATDTLKDTELYWDIVGGTFNGHPWGAGSHVTITVHDTEHPAMRPFGASFEYQDEIYQYNHWQPEKCHVLMSLDMEKTQIKRPYHVPVAWCKQVGEGRVFVNNLGHREETWQNEVFLESTLAAIHWTAGNTQGDATPNPEVSAAQHQHSVQHGTPAEASK